MMIKVDEVHGLVLYVQYSPACPTVMPSRRDYLEYS